MLTSHDASAIAAAFDFGADPVLAGPVARGEVGQVWRLTTDRSTWAVKEAFEPPSLAAAEHDAVFQELVTAHGVSAPTVRRTTNGAVLAEVAGSLVRAYSWVELADRDPMIDPVAVGALVASIHRVVHVDGNGVDPWYTDPVGPGRWDDLIAAAHEACAPWADRLADQRDDLVALEALLRAPAQLQVCHRDLFADNVRAMPSGGLCVIDWENSGLADPSQELALVLFEYGCGDDDRSRVLYESYLAAGGPGRIRQPEDFTMVIAQIGHIGEDACRAWLDPARRHERDRHDDRVEEFLSSGITVGTIDGILAAIS